MSPVLIWGTFCDDEDELFVLRCLKTRFKDFHRNKLDGYGCWKRLNFVLIPVCWIFPCADLTFIAHVFEIGSHVRPSKLAFIRTQHVMMAGTSNNWTNGKWRDCMKMCWQSDGGKTIYDAPSMRECQTKRPFGMTLSPELVGPTWMISMRQ